MTRRIRWILPSAAATGALLWLTGCTTEAVSEPGAYFPPPGEWARKAPEEVGMDPAKLAAAVEFASSQETTRIPKDFSGHEILLGEPLGPLPAERAGTNGVVIRHGYLVAEFGETHRPDPTYSVAKSMLATVAGVAVARELIPSLDEPVRERIRDGGYDSPQNRTITWRHHLQQEAEWEGKIWGRRHDFVGRKEFGDTARDPRPLEPPGTRYDYNNVAINRFALSLLRLFGKPIPEVFRDEVMDPIAASDTWRWVPYENSYVDIDGLRMPSVSGGTQWGGGVWIDTYDLARFGYLWLRGGFWGERQILPAEFVRDALVPSAHGPDYGYLWWLNTRQEQWPGLPRTAYGARGDGWNTVFVSPEHDLVIVWRWHRREAGPEFFRMVAESVDRTPRSAAASF